MNPYLQLMRPSVVALGALGVLVGSVVSGFFEPIQIIIAILVVFLIAGAGNTINDYFDYKADKINRPNRPIPSGKVSRKNALRFSIVLYSIAIVLSIFLNPYCLALALLNTMITILYSWNLKKQIFLGNFIPSWLAASSFLFGGFLTGGLSYIVLILSGMSFFANTGREVIKDIEDIDGDEKIDSNTIPMAFGVNTGKIISIAYVVVAILFIPMPYLMGLLGLYYIPMIAVSVMMFIYSFKLMSKNIRESQKFMKIAMFVAIIAFLLGTI